MQPVYISPVNALGSLGEKIFLDRYSLKDGKKETLAVGDTVVVLLDPKSSQREIGEVVSMAGDSLEVTLRDGASLKTVREHVDKPLELHVEDMMERVARGAAQVEKEEVRESW